MRVRAVDSNNDWLFGKGQNDYLRDKAALLQNIKTRLQEFLGDCFFNTGAGIDWFGLLGEKDQLSLNLAISSVILNTQYVTGIRQLLLNVENRGLTVQYEVATSYGPAYQTFALDQSI